MTISGCETVSHPVIRRLTTPEQDGASPRRAGPVRAAAGTMDPVPGVQRAAVRRRQGSHCPGAASRHAAHLPGVLPLPQDIDARAHEFGLRGTWRADNPTRARSFGIRSATVGNALGGYVSGDKRPPPCRQSSRSADRTGDRLLRLHIYTWRPHEGMRASAAFRAYAGQPVMVAAEGLPGRGCRRGAARRAAGTGRPCAGPGPRRRLRACRPR